MPCPYGVQTNMHLRDHFTHPEIEGIFCDEATLSFWFGAEVALAQAQADVGVIPAGAAAAIDASVETYNPDMSALSDALERAGVPIAEFVRQMKQWVAPPHNQYVHYGATTQDILDTTVAFQLSESIDIIERLLNKTIVQLGKLADEHRETLMAGRTRSQVALPTTFGLKVANWLAPLIRQRDHLQAVKTALLVVQFGGAVGNLSALGDDGLKVQERLAERLNLGVPMTVWHNQRDNIAQFASWLSVTTGALATMAQNVILMAQSEVGELMESDDPTRGGSSTMPQKRNPVVSDSLITIHKSNVGHLSAIHSALPQEHERANGNWQVEWLNLPPMVSMTAAALEKAVWLTENLVVNTERMAQNVAATNGLMMAEAARLAIAPYMDDAKQVVRTAALIAQDAQAENRHLIDILQEQLNFPIDWASLRDERNYLGVTDQLISRILAQATS